MYQFEEIRHLHLEPTTRCNAACPMCARNVRGRQAPGLPLAELGLHDLIELFDPSLLGRLEAIDLCGAYGDPALTRELPSMLRYLREHCQGRITIYTNGGIRRPDWWAELARVLDHPCRVVFAIDGLSDTHGIHRRQVDFNRVIINARAFIEAGGAARWEYLVFRHNAHQIRDARALSEELGFEEFSVKRSNRFLEPLYEHVPEVEGDPNPDQFPIHDVSGSVVDYLEPPEEQELVNGTVRNLPSLLERWGTLDALFDATPIRCRVLDTGSVFLSATGHAYPCCWVYVQATRPGVQGYPEGADLGVHRLVLRSGGYEALDARRHGLKAVVESTFFRAVSRSWSCGSIEDGRLGVCARACGTAFPAYLDQFVDLDLLPRGLGGGAARPRKG